jgi:hypothetical protein
VHTLARIVWHAALASWALLRAQSCLLRFNIWTDCDDENANRSEQRAKNKSRFCASFALANGSANKTANDGSHTYCNEESSIIHKCKV